MASSSSSYLSSSLSPPPSMTTFTCTLILFFDTTHPNRLFWNRLSLREDSLDVYSVHSKNKHDFLRVFLFEEPWKQKMEQWQQGNTTGAKWRHERNSSDGHHWRPNGNISCDLYWPHWHLSRRIILFWIGT